MKLGSRPHDSLSHLEINSNTARSVVFVLLKPGVSTRTMLPNLVALTSLVHEVSVCPTPPSFLVTLLINYIALRCVRRNDAK